jgi:hypothetical protein
MKRVVLIIIATAIAGKLFALLISSIVKNPAEKIKGSLFFDKITQEQIHQNKVDQQVAPTKTGVKSPQVKLPVLLPVIAKSTKVQEEKLKKIQTVALAKAKAAKEKDRRKKRRKKLEDIANKKPEAPKFSVQVAPQDFYTQREVAYGIGGVNSTTTAPSPAKKAVAAAPALKPNVVASVNLGAITLRLLHTPNYADMTTLMKYYRDHRISQAEYYNVLNQMQAGSNVDSRRLSVMGASMEQNFDAFQVLSKESIDEDTSARETAGQSLKAYENISALPVLSEALQGGVLVSKIMASNILNEVAKGFQATPNPDPNQRNMFAQFVEILKPLAEDHSEPTLQASAQATLATIQRILA